MFQVTLKKGFIQLKATPFGKIQASFQSISYLSLTDGGLTNFKFFIITLLLMIFTTRSSFSLKNSCLNIQRLDSYPSLSSGLSLSSFFRRSLTVLFIDFLSKLIVFPFISSIVQGVMPSNGLDPTNNSQKSSPKQQISKDVLYPYLLTIYGAKYSQLPHRAVNFWFGSILQAKPKSQILISPFQFSRMFQGFKSLQMMPAQCSLTIPKAIWIQIVYLSVRVSFADSQTFLLVLIILQRSPWGQYSKMKYTYLQSSN